MIKIDKNTYKTLKNKIINISKTKFSNINLEYGVLAIIPILMVISIILGNVGSTKVVEEKIAVTITDNKAEEFFYAADYAGSIDEYNKLIASDNKNSWWQIKLSEVYSVKGDIDSSRRIIEGTRKTLLIDNDENRKEKVINYIIFTEFMNKDYKLALDDGKEALIKYPKDKSIYKTMFTVYMANADTKSASAMISKYPLNTSLAYDMAEFSGMLMSIGRWDEGITNLKNAWNLDKDEYKVFDVLSQSYSYNKDIILEKVTNLSTNNPQDAAYKIWLAKIYSMNADTSDQANTLLNSIGQVSAGKIEINLIRATILQNTNKKQNADELLNSIIKQYPSDYRVLHTAGWYYLNKNDYVNALKYCKESIVKNKDYPDNYGSLMPEILKAQGESIEGEPYFRIALSKEPYNINIMINIANYYSATAQNFNKAIDYYKMAEIIKPLDSEIKYNMASTCLKAKDEKQAIDLLNQCVAISAATPKFHRMLGAIYLLEKNSDEGIKETRLAYQADERDSSTLNNAGVYYINFEADVSRGILNLQKAVEGINSSTDEDVKKIINDNYAIAKKLQSDYNSGIANQKLKIPNLELLY